MCRRYEVTNSTIHAILQHPLRAAKTIETSYCGIADTEYIL